jgi:hypothetical protein
VQWEGWRAGLALCDFFSSSLFVLVLLWRLWIGLEHVLEVFDAVRSVQRFIIIGLAFWPR